MVDLCQSRSPWQDMVNCSLPLNLSKPWLTYAQCEQPLLIWSNMVNLGHHGKTWSTIAFQLYNIMV